MCRSRGHTESILGHLSLGTVGVATDATGRKPFADDQIHAAAEAAYVKARPLDNTDFVYQWRKQMARQYTLQALKDLQS